LYIGSDDFKTASALDKFRTKSSGWGLHYFFSSTFLICSFWFWLLIWKAYFLSFLVTLVSLVCRFLFHMWLTSCFDQILVDISPTQSELDVLWRWCTSPYFFEHVFGCSHFLCSRIQSSSTWLFLHSKMIIHRLILLLVVYIHFIHHPFLSLICLGKYTGAISHATRLAHSGCQWRLLCVFVRDAVGGYFAV
jgi:hypothetical protein